MVWFVLCFFGQRAEANTFPKYLVDSSKIEEIKSKITFMNSVPLGSMEIKWYENDILLFDTSTAPEGNVEFYTITTFENDSAYVTGIVGLLSGLVFI